MFYRLLKERGNYIVGNSKSSLKTLQTGQLASGYTSESNQVTYLLVNSFNTL